MSPPRSPREDLRVAARGVAGAGRAECVSEERLLAFQAGTLPDGEQDEVRDHLAVCASCVSVGRDARRFLEAMGERVVAEAPLRAAWQWQAVIAAGMALALIGLWFSGRSRPVAEPRRMAGASPTDGATRTAGGWSDVTAGKAAYAPPAEELIFRDEGAGDAAADAFARAMEPYRHDDFAAAARALTSYLALHSGDERAHFYRGVSLLLLGRARESRAPLQRVADGGSRLALDARWYLALACLRDGEADAAARHLEVVERSSHERRAEARELLLRLRGAQGR